MRAALAQALVLEPDILLLVVLCATPWISYLLRLPHKSACFLPSARKIASPRDNFSECKPCLSDMSVKSPLLKGEKRTSRC